MCYKYWENSLTQIKMKTSEKVYLQGSYVEKHIFQQFSIMQKILEMKEPGCHQVPAGADYGLGTIGTCLGPPPAVGPPADQK